MKPIVAITMLRRWSSSPTSLPAGGRLWTAHAPCRIFFLAAKSLGIGSCWINQLGQTCDDPDVRAFLTRLGIPENHRVYGCAALGYAPADAPVKEKKLAAGTVTVIR